MSIDYVTGDLFDDALYGSDRPALAQGVNCSGVMGAGIAPLFRSRWPDMYLAYRAACRSRTLTLGSVLPWVAPDGRTIYNLATQDRPGRHAVLGAVQDSVQAMLVHAEQTGVHRVALPRIGAGIGGLVWADVNTTLAFLADRSPVRVTVVSLPDRPRR